MLSEEICTAPGCTKNISAKGLCQTHYMRQYRTGDHTKVRTNVGAGKGFKWIESIIKNPPEGCAIWPFSILNSGYCQVAFNNKKWLSHRLALHLFSGESRPGLVAKHGECNNRLCCNPHHLSWGTYKENSADMNRDNSVLNGQLNPGAKLTKTQVIEIRSLKGVVPQSELARQFRVSQSNISFIHNNKSWRKSC